MLQPGHYVFTLAINQVIIQNVLGPSNDQLFDIILLVFQQNKRLDLRMLYALLRQYHPSLEPVGCLFAVL